MAPCPASSSAARHAGMSEGRSVIRPSKPVVEKMRRDRINSCIEQLRVLLEKEFHKQNPYSKLDKGDILEMTVSFLRQRLQSGLCHADFSQGSAHCWRDSGLSASSSASAEASVTPPPGLQQQEQKLQQAQRASSSTLRARTLQDSSSSRRPVWRPW